MRTIVTGASGFVGSNIAKVLSDRHGDIVIDTRVDMVDAGAVKRHVDDSEADAVVHCAILNDWELMHADRQSAWNSYVEATRHSVSAVATAERLGTPLLSLDDQLVAFRHERTTGQLAPLPS